MEISKKCKACSNDFVAKSQKAEYCSNACKLVSFRKRQKLRIEHENRYEEKTVQNDFFEFLEKLEVLETKQHNLEQDFMKGTMSLVENFVSRSEIEYLKEDIKENRSLIKKLIETNDTILKENLQLKEDYRKMENAYLEINRAFTHLNEDMKRYIRIQEEDKKNNSITNESTSLVIENIIKKAMGI